MIGLVLIDVDGTLIGKQGIHPTTWRAIGETRRAGIRVGLCTGRIGAGDVQQHARHVAADGLHIFQSGAVISGPGEPAVQCWLAAHHGLDPADIAMIGDGVNDIDALQAAGLAIVMGDAPDAVKRLGHVVVADADHGGVAQALDEARRRSSRRGRRSRSSAGCT